MGMKNDNFRQPETKMGSHFIKNVLYLSKRGKINKCILEIVWMRHCENESCDWDACERCFNNFDESCFVKKLGLQIKKFVLWKILDNDLGNV